MENGKVLLLKEIIAAFPYTNLNLKQNISSKSAVKVNLEEDQNVIRVLRLRQKNDYRKSLKENQRK